jgi:hypothetical protein
MKPHQTVTLDLPVRGTGREYVGAIARAIADADCSGDSDGAQALVGLMSALKLPANQSPDLVLGPWLADV